MIRVEIYHKENLAEEGRVELPRPFGRQFSKLLWLPFHHSSILFGSRDGLRSRILSRDRGVPLPSQPRDYNLFVAVG